MYYYWEEPEMVLPFFVVAGRGAISARVRSTMQPAPEMHFSHLAVYCFLVSTSINDTGLCQLADEVN